MEGEGFIAGNLPVTMLAQYIKDLSFENPHAPETLRRNDTRPVMDANFSMDARKIEWEGRDFIYEVTLGLQTAARKGDKTAFMCEIKYGVLVDNEPGAGGAASPHAPDRNTALRLPFTSATSSRT